jgi:sugar lactone lactonase YvrE
MKTSVFMLLILFFALTAVNGYGYDVIRTDAVLEVKGSEKYEMNQPSDVTVGPRGNIYVLDGANDRILSFDSEGELLFSLFHLGREHGSFRSPLGMNIDSEGNLLVADSAAGRIVVFGRDGRLKKLYDLPSDRLPADPTDIVSDIEHHYIVDNDNHRILVYRADGTFFNTFGKEGEGPSQFRFPYKIEMDRERRLYVVDVLNARIQVLTTSGNYLGQIGNFGVTPGTLFRPNGIAFDKAGRILVSDSYLGVVQAFDRSGGFLGVIGDEHGKLLRFKSPAGLFVDEANRLYIVDMPEGKVYVRDIVE